MLFRPQQTFSCPLFISSPEYRGCTQYNVPPAPMVGIWISFLLVYNFSDIASALQTKTLYANYSHQLHHDFCPAVLHQLSTYDVTPASMATGSEVLLENKNSSCSWILSTFISMCINIIYHDMRSLTDNVVLSSSLLMLMLSCSSEILSWQLQLGRKFTKYFNEKQHSEAEDDPH